MKTDAYAARRAFALIELLIVLLIAAGVLVVVMIASSDSRRRARLSGSIANLQFQAAGYQAYSKDNADRIASFSWRANINYGFGGVAGNDNDAAAHQAVDIMRRRGNRPDMGVIGAWIPHINYNHLVLVDYLEQELPAKWTVSPGDTQRLAWQRDPVNFESLDNRPVGTGNVMKRWPYSSSYEIGPAFFSPDQFTLERGGVWQGTTHYLYLIAGNTEMGRRTMSEVSYPSQKAMIWEQHARFFGARTAFCLYPEARVPTLFVDGSVSVRGADDCNPGFTPGNPNFQGPSTFNYEPAPYDAPALSGGAAADQVIGRMRYTKRGLHGRDYGAAEVP